jgi:hypothetical protein
MWTTTKNRAIAAVLAPRFLALVLAFTGEKANEIYAANSAGTLSCHTRFVLQTI